MRYTDKEGKTLNLDKNHPSNGTELIPAEVQANTRHDGSKMPDKPLAHGYTVDEEGLNNNYAIEPEMSSAEYPSPQQQGRYILWGVGAILFVAVLVLVGFLVS
ncbi:MAG TPA: ssl1498 family light-harvesting-like protein [Coleofasciculaceae cyanobacterium]